MANPLGKKLLGVSRPARYIGGEYGEICKPWDSAKIRWALAFPEVYEIGMSHLGLQILHYILNNCDNVLADRVYAPWFDMEELLEAENQKLWGLKTGRPLTEFDVVGITIPYELTYTNIVSILRLGGIEPLASERSEGDPLVIGGGCGAFNPEPVADFFDAILLGDGEEAVVEISKRIIGAKDCGISRGEMLEDLSSIGGLYIPSLGTQRWIRRETVSDLNRAIFPDKVIVPNLKIVHDRVGVEIQRGCTRGCRFCQAGMIYRPDRQRAKEQVADYAEKNINYTGYEECALLTLSAGDYDGLPEVLADLDKRFGEKRVHISLPSLRTESLGDELVKVLSRSMKGGFTLAPEAATERLRGVINKGNTEENLLAAVEKIFSTGWKNLKLYFMIGLPCETDEDIDAIPILVRKALAIARRCHKRPNITINISTFVPKSHTPFQWEEQISLERTKDVHGRLRDKVIGPGLKLKLHNPEMSFLEGVFSRGDRKLAKVVLAAYEKGCRFDAWDDQLKFNKWMEAFNEHGIDPGPYLAGRSESKPLPWDHLFTDLDRDFLIDERKKARAGEPTPDCSREGCVGCGVCDFERVKNVIASEAKQSPVYKVSTGDCFALRARNDMREAQDTQHIFRYRICFSKTKDAIFIGHLDLMNIWRRALQRADLPLNYSQGFNPRPKISFSQALRVGVESLDQWCEIELTDKYGSEEIKSALAGVFPGGIDVLDIFQVEKKGMSVYKGQRSEESFAAKEKSCLTNL